MDTGEGRLQALGGGRAGLLAEGDGSDVRQTQSRQHLGRSLSLQGFTERHYVGAVAAVAVGVAHSAPSACTSMYLCFLATSFPAPPSVADRCTTAQCDGQRPLVP